MLSHRRVVPKIKIIALLSRCRCTAVDESKVCIDVDAYPPLVQTSSASFTEAIKKGYPKRRQ